MSFGGNHDNLISTTDAGARPTTPAFGDHVFSLFNQPPVGSRVCSYAQTPEEDDNSGTLPARKLELISAMPRYKGKTHEELRWEEYRIGDKGDLKPVSSTTPTNSFAPVTTFGTPLFAFPPAQSQTPSGIFARPGYYATPSQSPFDKPNTSNPIGPAQANTPSVFNTASSFPPGSSLFRTPASNPFVPAQAQTPSVFNKSSNRFGTPTSPSSFGTPNTSTFGTPSSTSATTQAQGATSSFTNGINPGTQSANLFQSSSPTPGQTSSPFGQPPFVEAAPNHVYVAQTCGIGGFNQNSFEQMFTNLYGALRAMRQMTNTASTIYSNAATYLLPRYTRRHSRT